MHNQNISKQESSIATLDFVYSALPSREVKDLIVRALEYVQEESGAKATLNKAAKLLDSRQKLIRIADASPYGWATVSEYEAHEVADDESDDNKITRAENRAGKQQTLTWLT